MPDGRLDIEFDLEACRLELSRCYRRSHRGDGPIVLAVHEEHGRVLTRAGDRRWRQETCERHECADLPSSGGDRVKGDDRALRHTDESDPGERVFETLFPSSIADGLIESLSHGLDASGL